jgi:hypothetical protein
VWNRPAALVSALGAYKRQMVAVRKMVKLKRNRAFLCEQPRLYCNHTLDDKRITQQIEAAQELMK